MAKNYLLKTVLSMLSLLLVSILPAGGQIGYALNEDFESGKIPDEWSQEYEAGNTGWIIEQGGEYPEGDSWRAALRNTTGQTQGFRTKLVSPVMKLRDVYQPILIFSHAQDQYLGDVDVLKVYYRTDVTEPWVQFREEYTSRIREWKTDTIRLISQTDSYQIAFEGTDRFGRGIVLDDIKVRPMPTCDIPVIQTGTEVTSTSFNLVWSGSFDTESFAVRISKTPLDDPDDINEDTEIAIDTIVNLSFQCLLENLDVNTIFYCYVKAFCPGEESGWSDVYTYRTQATVTLPHKEPFDLPYNQGFTDQLATWTWGNSWSTNETTAAIPFINTNTDEKDRGNYSRNATTCVVFSSGGITTALPAGSWAYIASPEIRGIESLKEVQVSFWGSVYQSAGEGYASSLIVGAMSDPEDINTFVPIETVTISKSQFFQEFQVSFGDKDTGPGKFIAFLSRFDEPNLFYLDDVQIELIGDCPKAGGLSANYVYPTSAEITWNEVAGASGYNVFITSKSVADPDNPGVDFVYRTGSPVSANVYRIPDNTLQPFRRYYAYVQSECGGSPGLWSGEYTFLTSFAGELPLYYTFETGTEDTYVIGRGSSNRLSTGLYGHSTSFSYIPYNYKIDRAFEGDHVLYIQGRDYHQTCVTFPAVDDLSNVRVTFYGYESNPKDKKAVLEVGVMSHIDDLYTFDLVETITVENEWNHFTVNFDKYTGKGKNIAFYLPSTASETQYIYIDNLTIEEIPQCDYPRNQGVNPGEGSAEFFWDAVSEADEYRLILSFDPIDDPDNLGSLNIAKDTIVTTNSCLIKGLEKDKIPYYFTVRSQCGNSGSDWTTPVSFETLCFSKTPLPFTENFDSFEGGSSIQKIPWCWDTQFVKVSSSYGGVTTTSYYPYIYKAEGIMVDYSYSGDRALLLDATNTRQSYVALPGMNAEKVQDLQISFKYRMSSTSVRLEVGVLENLRDTSTFKVVETVGVTNNSIWHEATVRFNTYKFEGQHIMLRVLGSSSTTVLSAYIDDIEVDYIDDCFKPINLSASDIESTSAVIHWDAGKDETKWNLMVLKNNVRPDEVAEEDIVWKDIVTGNSHKLENLRINRLNYCYMQSICGDDTTGWTVAPLTFRTECDKKTVELWDVETFEDNETDFTHCWMTGLKTGTGAAVSIPNPAHEVLGRRLQFNVTLPRDNVYAIMPEVDIEDISDLQVTFNMYSDNYAVNNEKGIVVGIITVPDHSLETFIPLDTVRVLGVEDYERKFTVRFDKYTGDNYSVKGKHVMFMSPFGTTTINNIYFDNIYFDTIAPCPEPTKIWPEYVDIKTAKLLWNGEEGSSYRVVVSETMLSEDELNAGIISGAAEDKVLVQDTMIELSGLTEMTRYYVYIQNNCSPTEKGPWANEWFFTTKCPASYGLPFVENFDSYGTGSPVKPSCWTTYYGSPTTEAINYPNCNASYNNTPDGTASFYIFTASTSGYYCMAVTPRLNVTDISDYQFSFDVLQSAIMTTRVKMIVGLTKDPDDLVLDNILAIDTICITDDFEDALRYEWYQYRFDLSDLAERSDIEEYKHIVFAVVRELNRTAAGSAAEGGLFLDNLLVEEIPSCKIPLNLGYTNATTTSFVATWVDAVGTSWNVEYGESGFTKGAGTEIPADAQSVLISGLDPQTDYDFYVQADCGTDGKSEWAGPFTATTLCLLPPEGAEFGFEEEEGYYYGRYSTSNKLPECWTMNHDILAATSIPYIIDNTDNQIFSRTGNSALRLFVNSANSEFDRTYAIMPEIDADLDTMQLRFSARALYTNASNVVTSAMNYTNEIIPHLYVGTVDNIYDFSTFEEIMRFDLSRWANDDMADADNNFMWDDIILPLYGAKGKNVTFAISYKEAWNKTYHTYIDDVAIERETNCATVYDVRFDNYDLDVTTADLSWKILGRLNTSWSVRILTEQADVDAIASMDPSEFIYIDDFNSSDPVSIDIDPATTYYVYIRSVCEEGESEWKLTKILTPCPSAQLPVTYTFEEEGGQLIPGSADDIYAPDCWTVGLKTGVVQAQHPYKFPDIGRYTYSRSSGETLEHCLRFSTNITGTNVSENNGAYAIMPHFIGNMDTLQLNFHARTGYHYSDYTAGQGYRMAAGFTGLRSIIVGTVTSPDDISSFVPIRTIQTTLLKNTDYANEENNWLFDEITVSLAGAPGNYVAFLSEFEANNTIYIDDVSIQKLGACLAPIELYADSMTSKTANLSWQLSGENGVSWTVVIAGDAEMQYIISEQPASSDTRHMATGLSPNTTYYAAVKETCQNGDESWSDVVEFTTAHVISFDETFSNTANIQPGWITTSCAFTGDIITDKDVFHRPPSAGYGWIRTSSSFGLPGPHMKIQVTMNLNYWLATPVIHLEKEEDTWLLFDLAYTMNNSPLPISGEGLSGANDRFAVIISEDAGATWDMANATEWNNRGSEYVLNDISATGEQVQINLTKYAGKRIKVAFYMEAGKVDGRKNDLHIDNVHINRFVEDSYEGYLCAGKDYTDRGFDIPYDDLVIGKNEYTNTNLSNTSVEDSILHLTLYVADFTRTLIDDAEVCEGKTYTDYGFNVKGEGEFKQKLMCFASDCDSVVILNLSNIPAERETIRETICQGKSYNFNGKEYNRSDVYVDTLMSEVTHCDSIVTLVLTVNAILRDQLEETICFGSTYDFNGKELSVTDTYLDTVKIDGCDCEVTLNLTVREDLRTEFSAYVCPGEEYIGHGFDGVPALNTTYTRDIKSVLPERCDSTITLHMTVLDEDTTRREETIKQSMLPYTFNNIRYEAGTPAGTYSDTTVVQSESGECESVLISTLYIEADDVPDGLWSATADGLTIIPSVIEKGESVQIIYDLSSSAGLKVEVYDMTGRCVYTQHPTVEPIEINAFPNSGMYLIRAISAQGHIHHGRVIVK